MKASELRASLLISAFSGDLTKQWRIDNNINDNSWHSFKLIDLCQSFADCPHSTPEWVESGILCLRTFNIFPRKLDLSVTSYVSEKTYLERIERLVPQENDIVYSREGASVCSACLIPKGLKLCLGQRLVIMRVKSDISPAYIMYYLNSPNVLTQVNKEERGIAAKHVNVKSIKNYQINLPPLSEQRRIVAKLDELMPLVDAYEKEEEALSKLNAGFPERMRKSILQEAVSGKLVPQIESEGSAAELLKEIEAEKKALVAAGKLKKEKPLPAITEEEKPFEIPESWEWVRLGEIFSHNNGKQLNASDTAGRMMTYITTSNLYWDHFVLDNLKEMPFEDDEIERCSAIKGDLLVCEGGDVGRAAIWDYDYPIRLQNHLHKLRAYNKLETKFYYYCLYYYKLTGKIGGKGIGIQSLSANVLHKICLPLPPIYEQQRIVEKVEELMKIIDEM